MITNYYTLFHVSAELNQTFSERCVDEIFTQHRSELILSFTQTPAVIVIGCEPSNNFLYAREHFARARRNTTNLFAKLQGSMIKSIFIHPNDRQIHIRFNTAYDLVIQLFGSKANVLLLDSSDGEMESFLKKPVIKTAQKTISPQGSYPTTPETFLSMYGDQHLRSALKQMLPLFGTVLLQELLTRMDYPSEYKVQELLANDIVRLLNSVQQLITELLSPPSPRIYFDGTSPIRLSVIPLQHLNEFQVQPFDSLSEAIHSYRAKLSLEKATLHEKQEIVKVLERELEHSERTLDKISAELEAPNRADQYKNYGKLLIAQLHLIKKGDTTALVEDFIGGSNELIEIPLDPHLTPVKNAERYFEKSDKSRHAAVEQHLRLNDLTQQQISLSRLLAQTEEIVTSEDIKQFAEENRKALANYGIKIEKSGKVKKEEPIPFRVFRVAGGFQVWAGKSGENNDLLSTRHTAKNDLWFHARGVGGSHVVLKMGTGKGEVSKQAIEQAAAIAAYYSKMKNSKLVSVTMCEGKYVRKPKGVPAGTVMVEREKTIFAEPKLPQP